VTVKPDLPNNEMKIRFHLKDGTYKISSKSKIKSESTLSLQTPIASTAALFSSPYICVAQPDWASFEFGSPVMNCICE